MRRGIGAAIGSILVIVSAIAVVQSLREWQMWERGGARYSEETFGSDSVVSLAGLRITASDDQPVDSVYSEQEFEGRLAFLVNGVAVGEPTRARVRRGRTDFGRYHLWADVWRFVERPSGDTTLWLVRRIQERDADAPLFEVVTLTRDGTRQRTVYRIWELGRSYPLLRSTQFIRHSTSAAFPLSMLEAFIFPPVLLVFPLGTLVVGIWLLVRVRRAPGTVAP